MAGQSMAYIAGMKQTMEALSPAVDILPQAVANLDLRPSSPPAQLPTEKTQPTACDSVGGTDSGYASQAASPDQRSTPESCQVNFPPGVVLPSCWLFKRKVTRLKPFDKEIPQATQDRFRDLRELFDKPFVEHLVATKPDVQIKSLSIKLMVLGESETFAKPWVVVFCDASLKKPAEKYFNQHSVRAHFQSRELDPDLPSLDVVVCTMRPKLLAMTQGLDIYGDFGNNTKLFTLCGTIIKASTPDGTRLGRIGGVVKVTDSDGVSKLYAMTSEHIFYQEHATDDELDSEPSADEDIVGWGYKNKDEDFFQDGEEFEIDLAGEEPCEGEEGELAASASHSTGQARTVSVSWSKIGHIAQSSQHDREDAHNMDWGLVELDDPSGYRPNLLFDPYTHKLIDLIYPSPKQLLPARDKVKERVVVLNNTSTWALGVLSTFSSFLMVAPGKSLIETHTLTMDDESRLTDGDSGSWVVHHATGKVFGHVVASDVFLDAYVVPVEDTLADISTKLMGLEVSLPTRNEVQDLIAHVKGFPPVGGFDSGYSSMKTSPSSYPTVEGFDSGYSSMNTSPSSSETSTPSGSPPIDIMPSKRSESSLRFGGRMSRGPIGSFNPPVPGNY